MAEQAATHDEKKHRNPWASVWHFLLTVVIVALVVALVAVMVAGVAVSGIVLLLIILIGWPIAAFLHRIKAEDDPA